MNMRNATAEAVWGRARQAPQVSVLATVVVGVSLFLCVGLFHVWSRVAILEQGYALSRQRTSRDELLQEQRALSLHLARLRDPSRLESAAKSMGLVAALPGQVIFLEKAP